MDNTNFKEIYDDIKEKRGRMGRDLEVLAQDPRKNKTKAYFKLLSLYDTYMKRLAEVGAMLNSEEEENGMWKDLFGLVDWARKYREEEKKQQLMAIKDFPSIKRSLMVVRKANGEPTKIRYNHVVKHKEN